MTDDVKSGMGKGVRAASGIYFGRIMHHRFSPKRHYFTYPVFIFAIDLDQIESWDHKLRLFGHNRFSLYALFDSDHTGTPPLPSPKGEGRSQDFSNQKSGLISDEKESFNKNSCNPPSPLGEGRGGVRRRRRSEGVGRGGVIKRSLIQLLRDRGYAGPVDQIVMVTQFRVLGYIFNPVTFYYCYANGEEIAYVAEVNNTFHQRHSYVFFGEENSFKNSFEVDKVFYVSPYLEMDVSYRYRFEPLGPDLRVHIDDFRMDDNGTEHPILKTRIVGKYHPLSDWNLLKSFLKIPFMSVWIIAWIHWQALKLWLKKVPLVFRPHDGMKPGWVQPAIKTQSEQA